MTFDWKQLLKNLRGIVVGALCMTPFALQILSYMSLPFFHVAIRGKLDFVWRYHIADSSVTVGLAYYILLAFILWQTKRTGWNATSYLMDECEDLMKRDFSRPFWKKADDPDGEPVAAPCS